MKYMNLESARSSQDYEYVEESKIYLSKMQLPELSEKQHVFTFVQKG